MYIVITHLLILLLFRNNPNKIIIYSRSSSYIHSLPSHYTGFPLGSSEHCDKKLNSVLHQIFENTSTIIVQKLSNVSSQSSMEHLLDNFVQSENHDILFIVANMRNISKSIINHVRIMIEEAECRTQIENYQNLKMFIFLLHFPPSMFYSHCYPTIFLRGWDHIYLDNITQSDFIGDINIKFWIDVSFSYISDIKFIHETATNLLSRSKLLTAISAQLHYGSRPGKHFNSSMTLVQRQSALTKLVQRLQMGQYLCIIFCRYWNPNIMLDYLQNAALDARKRESTLSITESIQIQFYKLFTNFCIYMLNKANENYNLDIIYVEVDQSTPVQDLFLDILNFLPTPSLDDLCCPTASAHLPLSSWKKYEFPFFLIVCSSLEQRIEVYLERLSEKEVRDDSVSTPLVQQHGITSNKIFQTTASAIESDLQHLQVRT